MKIFLSVVGIMVMESDMVHTSILKILNLTY